MKKSVAPSTSDKPNLLLMYREAQQKNPTKQKQEYEDSITAQANMLRDKILADSFQQSYTKAVNEEKTSIDLQGYDLNVAHISRLELIIRPYIIHKEVGFLKNQCQDVINKVMEYPDVKSKIPTGSRLGIETKAKKSMLPDWNSEFQISITLDWKPSLLYRCGK